jgi:hypothetical protein
MLDFEGRSDASLDFFPFAIGATAAASAARFAFSVVGAHIEHVVEKEHVDGF